MSLEDFLVDELILLVLSHLDVPTLCLACRVNQHFFTLASDNSLWRAQCHNSWWDKQKWTYAKFLDSACSIPWKQRFVLALQDSKRCEITSEELMNLSWQFSYKVPRLASMDATFEPNFLVLQGYPRLPWRLNANVLCISDFPGHSVSRSWWDWGFVIQNRNVLFWTTDNGLLCLAQELTQKGKQAYINQRYAEAKEDLEEAIKLLHGVGYGLSYDHEDYDYDGRFGLLTWQQTTLRIQTLVHLALSYSALDDKEAAQSLVESSEIADIIFTGNNNNIDEETLPVFAENS